MIILGFLLLFGYRKLPDASRSLGRSLRIFKSEMRETTGNQPATERPVAEGESPVRAGTSLVSQLDAQAAHEEALAAELRAGADANPAEPQATR